MQKTMRLRQQVSALPSQAEVDGRSREGWKLVSVEWEKEVEAQDALGQASAELPFGLRVAGDCLHLEEDPNEMQTLLVGMELLIQESPFSRIADELNRRGLHDRNGAKWTPVSFFNLLPRLVEVGPRIFSSEEWPERRKQLYRMAGVR